jgi:hypothetical protein
MEGAMPTKNLPGKSAPRVESNHRAREARLQVEQFERLLVKRHAVKASRLVRLFRLLGFSISRSTRSGDRSTRPPSDRRPCSVRVPLLVAELPGSRGKGRGRAILAS